MGICITFAFFVACCSDQLELQYFPWTWNFLGASALQLGCAMEGCPNLPWLSKAIFNRPNGQKGWRGSGITLIFGMPIPTKSNQCCKEESIWWEKQEKPQVFPFCPKKMSSFFLCTPTVTKAAPKSPLLRWKSQIFTLTPAAKSTLPFGWSKPALFPCSLYSINVSVLSTMKERLKKC